jgi:hypothetical protein
MPFGTLEQMMVGESLAYTLEEIVDTPEVRPPMMFKCFSINLIGVL